MTTTPGRRAPRQALRPSSMTEAAVVLLVGAGVMFCVASVGTATDAMDAEGGRGRLAENRKGADADGKMCSLQSEPLSVAESIDGYLLERESELAALEIGSGSYQGRSASEIRREYQRRLLFSKDLAPAPGVSEEEEAKIRWRVRNVEKAIAQLQGTYAQKFLANVYDCLPLRRRDWSFTKFFATLVGVKCPPRSWSQVWQKYGEHCGDDTHCRSQKIIERSLKTNKWVDDINASKYTSII